MRTLSLIVVLLVTSAVPAVQASASCTETHLYPPEYQFGSACPGASEVMLTASDAFGLPFMEVCDQHTDLCASGCGSMGLSGTDAIRVQVFPIHVDETTGNVCLGGAGTVTVQFT